MTAPGHFNGFMALKTRELRNDTDIQSVSTEFTPGQTKNYYLNLVLKSQSICWKFLLFKKGFFNF